MLSVVAKGMGSKGWYLQMASGELSIESFELELSRGFERIRIHLISDRWLGKPQPNDHGD